MPIAEPRPLGPERRGGDCDDVQLVSMIALSPYDVGLEVRRKLCRIRKLIVAVSIVLNHLKFDTSDRSTTVRDMPYRALMQLNFSPHISPGPSL